MYFQITCMIRKMKSEKKIMLFFIRYFLYAIFIKECIFMFENFFSANYQNFSIGRMKNPRSFLISN
eukprot:UN12286